MLLTISVYLERSSMCPPRSNGLNVSSSFNSFVGYDVFVFMSSAWVEGPGS